MTRKGNLRDSDRAAIKRYQEKTYKRFIIAFRLEEDEDIIMAFDMAHEHGITGRELVRDWFEAWQHKE